MMNMSELMSISEKIKTVQRFMKDYNDGIFWVQRPDNIFVIPLNIENLWQEVFEVVEESIC